MQWLAGLLLSWSVQATEFASYWDADWVSSQSEELCLLQQTIPGYGRARFTAQPGQPLIFELLGSPDLFAAGAVAINQVAPEWHPGYPDEQPVVVLEYSSGSVLKTQDATASALLISLYDGYEVELRHAASFGPPGLLWFRIGAMRMRPAYRLFMQCWQGEGSLGWAELVRTRTHFDWDKDQLTPETAQRLATVARFIAADPEITRVYIDGHTDATGTATYNNQLSARRARIVAQLLQQAGVAQELLVVRYHGQRYPVADNSTDQGRAENRRTTIRLERDRSLRVAASATAAQ